MVRIIRIQHSRITKQTITIKPNTRSTMNYLFFRFFLIITIVLYFFPFAKQSSAFKSFPKGYLVVSKICNPNTKEPSNADPFGENQDLNYSIRIDSLALITVSSDSCIHVTSIELKMKHKVTIYLSRKPVDSFWFTFEKYGSDSLALWYKPLYATWSLTSLRKSTVKRDCQQ
jgi:hypothetical protein